MDTPEQTRRARATFDVRVWCMLALTFSTGIADAVGYLGLDKVFTGNMTGNVVILGMGAAGGTGLPVLGPLLALVAFMVGAAAGGRTMRGQDAGWTRRSACAVAVVGVLFGAAAIVFATVSVVQGTVIAYGLTVGLAVAMGLQAAVARHVAVKDVTTVVVTSTITGLAADSRLGAGLDQPWMRRAGAVLLICLGALVGALLLSVSTWLAVAVPAVIAVAVAVVGDLASRPAAVA